MQHDEVPQELVDAAWPVCELHGIPWHDDAIRMVLAAVLTVDRAQTRTDVATEFRGAAQAISDSRGNNKDPLSEKIWEKCERDPEVPAVREDPRTIAEVAYRHLAAQVERGMG